MHMYMGGLFYMDAHINLHTRVMLRIQLGIGCGVLKTLVAHTWRKWRIPAAQGKNTKTLVAHTRRKGRIPAAQRSKKTPVAHTLRKGRIPVAQSKMLCMCTLRTKESKKIQRPGIDEFMLFAILQTDDFCLVSGSWLI